jgi:dGTPase
VHPVTSNDHIHTRLTHSLEVSCVGRSLGMRVGETLRDALPDWCAPSDLGMIVQSACLAHDIGNPPSATPAKTPFATGSSRPPGAAGWTT